MKNRKVAIGAGIAIIAVLLCIGGIILKNNNLIGKDSNIEALENKGKDVFTDPEDDGKDVNGNDIISIDENGNISYSYTDKKLLAVQEYMNTYNHIGMEIYIGEHVTNSDGSEEDNTIARYIAETHFDKNTVEARNFADYKSGQSFEEMPQIDFEETFGFDYTKYNKAFDMAIAFLKAQGFSIDLENVTPDEFSSDELGIEWNYLNGKSSVIGTMLKKVNYDSYIDSSCSYVLKEDNTGNLYLNYATASVGYTEGDKRICRYMMCKFYLFFDEDNNDNTSAGCTCGTDTDCNTGYDNGVDCYTSCDTESLDCD